MVIVIVSKGKTLLFQIHHSVEYEKNQAHQELNFYLNKVIVL